MPNETYQIKIFDKLVDFPRIQLCFGQSYSYSGTTSHAITEIPPIIQKALDAINKHYMKETKTKIQIYQMCLVNYYIGFHSDDEKQLIPNTPIYSISLGATRKFKLKIKDKFNQNVTSEHDLDQTKLEEYKIEPVSKSLLIMGFLVNKHIIN